MNTPKKNEIPTASIYPSGKVKAWVWLIPVLAVFGALFMMAKSQRELGPLIEVHFEQGHGIKPGDALRYRDIDIGRVEGGVLSANMDAVILKIRLHASAARIAAAGSQFWIVHPRVDFTGSKGLDTVVGAKYLRVVPGDGEKTFRFNGLEEAPVLDAARNRVGLNLSMIATSAGSLRPGAPVTYRDMTIGTIMDLKLTPDLQRVIIQARIFEPYTSLIREKTKFWRRSAASVSGGIFRGMTLDIGSMQEIMLGGVAISTPPKAPGALVGTGTIFTLHEDSEKDWQEWLTDPVKENAFTN